MSKLEMSFDSKLKQCPLCQCSDVANHTIDYQGIHISKCRNCSIQFMNPQYTDSYLTAFYLGYQKKDSEEHHRYGADTTLRELGHDYNLRQIESHVERGAFLSVGSGNGLDIKVAIKRGWEAEGYEIDKEYSEQLSRITMAPVHCGDFVSLGFDKQYACVYLHHVLEHPKNPGEYLTKIHEILRPGGILYIACPNINSVSANLKTVLEKLGLKKNVGKHYDTWHHLFYFSPGTLTRLLDTRYGFEVLYAGNDKKPKKGTKSIQESILDPIPYKSSFRLIAKKV